MKRDVTEVVESTCINIVDERTIHAYTQNPDTRYTYKLLSNKYYLTESASGAPATESTCYTTAQISEIPSPYDFIDPFLNTMAIATVCAIFLVSFYFILYPFYRRRG